MKKRDYSNDGITEEELQAELDQMHQEGKYSSPHKSINRKVDSFKFTRQIAIVVTSLTLLLVIFVWARSELSKDWQDGNAGAYKVNVSDFGESNLELAFDPKFTEGYLTLTGLGYDSVDSLDGGSLLSNVGMNMMMFEKFKNLAENQSTTDISDGSYGSSNFDQYYANKFYLRNNGDGVVKYYINIHVTANENYALQAARFMLVQGDATTGYDYHIYATPYNLDEVEDSYREQALRDPLQSQIIDWHRTTGQTHEIAAWNYETTADSSMRMYYFADPMKTDKIKTYDIDEAWLCEDLVYEQGTGFYDFYSCEFDEEGHVVGGSYFTLYPGQSVSYTFCVWYEASDINHNNSIANGGMSFTIDFKAFDPDYLRDEEETN